MARLKIKDAPLLTTIVGDEKIPTGGKGDFSVTVDMLLSNFEGRLPFATKTELENVRQALDAKISNTKTTLELSISALDSRVTTSESNILGVRQDLTTHKADKANPHSVTKQQVGLGNVDNTSDVSKPLSTATQNSLNLKLDKQEAQDKIYKNGAALPYDSSITYNEGAVVVKDGELQQKYNSDWVSVKPPKNTVDSVIDLASIKNPKNGDFVFVKSYHAGLNRGGSSYVFNESRKSENDGFLCINGWIMQIVNNTVTAEQAGAKCDGVTDDYEALYRVLNSPFEVSLGKGKYITTRTLRFFGRSKVIKGFGELDTVIEKTTNTLSGGGNRVINSLTMIFDVDAVFSVEPAIGDWYVQNVDFSGFSLKYKAGMTTRGIGVYIPLVNQSIFKRISTDNCSVGIKTVDCWMVTWDRVSCKADRPWVMGAQDTAWKGNGTSNTFLSCWAHSTVGEDNYAYDFYSMQYTVMNACGVDYVGLDGNPAGGVFRFINSTVTLIGCGTEKVHSYNFIHAQSSYVEIIGGSYQQLYNKYKRASPAWRTTNATFRLLTNARINLVGVELDVFYNSSTEPNCTAMAFVDDNSMFLWDKQTTNKVPIEEVKQSSAYTYTKLGVYYNANSQIDIKTVTSDYNYSLGSTWGRANVILGGSKTQYLDKNIETTGYIQSCTKVLGNENLNSLRNLGDFTFSQSTPQYATTANNYPEVGGAWILEQICFGNTQVNNYCMQRLTRVDTNIPVLYIRTAVWGGAFNTWNKVTIV